LHQLLHESPSRRLASIQLAHLQAVVVPLHAGTTKGCDVLEADIVLVNLNTFGCPRPLIGTIFELAWVWHLRKRCIAICDPNNYLMHEHPFLKETIGHYFETLEAACRFIREQK
jgi:hypothetical protein